MEIFGTDIDLNGNEFKHLRPENLLSFPVSPTTGQIIMHTGLGAFYGYNGTTWKDLTLGGGGSYSLPIASDIILGGVKIDGTTITIDGGGTISAVAIPAAIIAQDDGNGDGYVLKDRDASKYSNIGLGAVDLTVNRAGEVDTDYGVESELGFSTGSANKLPAGVSNYGMHQAHGYGNIVQGYYNNMAYGTYNTITNGYSALTIGYSNTMNMTATVGHGCSIGGFNDSSSFWNNVFGFRLIGKSKGATIVGIGNTDYITTSGTGRPAFVIGVGDANSNGGATYGDIISRADGLIMNYAGELSLPTAYGSGVTIGTATYSLSVDASGNIIETPYDTISGFDYKAGIVTLGEATDNFQISFDFNEEGQLDLLGDGSTRIKVANLDFYEGTRTNYVRFTQDGVNNTNATATIPSVTGNINVFGTTINNQINTTYTLALNDVSNGVTLNNASPVTLTVPTQASVGFNRGVEIIIMNLGAGTVTVSPAVGVTIRQTVGLTLDQYDVLTIKKIDTDTWILF
tara:strand:- start:10329 stop:11870 length:1542 start_codon:yes stop_codon:yes gene_type:complete